MATHFLGRPTVFDAFDPRLGVSVEVNYARWRDLPQVVLDRQVENANLQDHVRISDEVPKLRRGLIA